MSPKSFIDLLVLSSGAHSPPALSTSDGKPCCGHPDKTFLLSEVTQPLKSPAQCTGLEPWAAVSRTPASPSRETASVLVSDKIVKPMD